MNTQVFVEGDVERILRAHAKRYGLKAAQAQVASNRVGGGEGRPYRLSRVDPRFTRIRIVDENEARELSEMSNQPVFFLGFYSGIEYEEARVFEQGKAVRELSNDYHGPAAVKLDGQAVPTRRVTAQRLEYLVDGRWVDWRPTGCLIFPAGLQQAWFDAWHGRPIEGERPAFLCVRVSKGRHSRR